MATLLYLLCLQSFLGSVIGKPQIAPELFLNRLNISYGINYKYNGQLNHNIDRVWVVTKIKIPKYEEIKFPSLPLGIDVRMVYTTLADGSNRVTVVLRNNTRDWLEIKKGVPIAQMVAANEVLKVTNLLSAEQTKEQSTLTEAERQDLLLEKLDLLGLEAWPEDQAGKAHSLLKEYHDIFSLEKLTWVIPMQLSIKLSSRIWTLRRSRSVFTGSHLLSWTR